MPRFYVAQATQRFRMHPAHKTSPKDGYLQLLHMPFQFRCRKSRNFNDRAGTDPRTATRLGRNRSAVTMDGRVPRAVLASKHLSP
jgi:hypothetical protein